MTKIYANSEEKYLMNTVIYAAADEGKVFYDEANSVEIPKDELKDLFIKGMTIVLDSKYLKPIVYAETSGYGVVTAIYEEVSTVTAVNFYSSEKSD